MRNYRKEYDNYHSRPEQKIRRAARNAARRRFADADPNKDVHHKDNNPLNNDKNNLSLVTQHYNRREPRLRKEDAASRAKEIADLRAKHADEIAKEREDRNKERETADKERERDREDAKKDREAAKKEEVEEDASELAAKQSKERERLAIVSKAKAKGLKAKHERERELQKKSDEAEREREKANRSIKKEATLVLPTTSQVDKVIISKFQEILKKAGFKKKQNIAKGFGIKLSQRGKKYQVEEGKQTISEAGRLEFDMSKMDNASKKKLIDLVQSLQFKRDHKLTQASVSMGKYLHIKAGYNDLDKAKKAIEKAGFKSPDLGRRSATKITMESFVLEGVDGDAMIDLMQKYLLTKNKKEKKVLLKQINRYQRKLGLAVTEMGTVTGPHIAGTGDDSTTVVVKKKKKKREEAMKDRDKAGDWEKRHRISKRVRKAFWKSFKKERKEDTE